MKKLRKKDLPPLSPEIKQLLPYFEDDLDLFLFYLKWIEQGLDASAAYRELHPNVTRNSSQVLGSKWLSRINREIIMQAYGLDLQLYLQELKGGLEAMGIDPYTGDKYKDYRARKPYHDKFGKLLGVEQEKGITINNTNMQVTSLNDFMDALSKKVAEEAEIVNEA